MKKEEILQANLICCTLLVCSESIVHPVHQMSYIGPLQSDA